MDDETFSDVDGEDPYYPETERTHVATTKSGRKIYSVRRLVVEPPPEAHTSGSDVPTSGTESDEDHEVDEESDSNDSFVESDNDGWNSDEYVPDLKKLKRTETVADFDPNPHVD